MPSADPAAAPAGHTPEGGVLVANASANQRMVLFEDQCFYCRQFEAVNGQVITTSVEADELAVNIGGVAS